MSSPAELKVRKLAKLPGNCKCPNCGRIQKHGFSTVCIKFHTFVCNDCKSSHQAISHRCKSITMSSWTDEEAQELECKGNEYALQTWLQHAPPYGQQGRPQAGSPISVYKRFVVDAYENRKYFGEYEGGTTAAVSVAAPAPAAATRAAPSSKRVVKKAPAPVAAPPVADLLDFSAPPMTTTTSDEVTPCFSADFGDFQTAAAPAPAAANAQTTTSTPSLLAPPPSAAAPKLAPPPSSAATSMFTGFDTTTTASTNSGMSSSMNPQSNAFVGMNGNANMMNGNATSTKSIMSNNGSNNSVMNAFSTNNGMPMNNAFQNGGMPMTNAFSTNGMPMTNAFQGAGGMPQMNGGMNSFQGGGGMQSMNGGMNAFQSTGGIQMNGGMQQPQQMNMMNGMQQPMTMMQQPQQPMMYHAQGMQATLSMNHTFDAKSGGQQPNANNTNQSKNDPFAGLGGF